MAIEPWTIPIRQCGPGRRATRIEPLERADRRALGIEDAAEDDDVEGGKVDPVER